ncbi:syntaxin-17-like [Littorina saxatilis]|uniref:t-SNARE coiled-coil homology domain-containing protein n=1 Tax=Littorina saxatilis TaxID=31220 RepID=A0AAN9B559_9CAEN
MASLSALKPSASEEDLVQGGTARSSASAANVQKFPIQRLKPSINKFQKVLEIDLDRLERHRNNIDRLTAMEDWVGLHKEQVNASRTVQQVKATLRELERARSQVFDDEVDQFDRQVQDAKVKAVAAVESFLRISQADQLQPEVNYIPVPEDTTDSREFSSLPATLTSPGTRPLLQTHLELHVVPENSQAAASGEDLLNEMEELNDLVHQFADVVKEQGEAVDRIEDNISSAHENVREGTTELGKASKLKYAVFPVFGAILGGVVAGPVGLLAGAKIGGLAGAFGGGVAGFAGGKILKSRHNKAVNMEMTNLSQKKEGSTSSDLGETGQGQGQGPSRSISTPELSSSLSPSTEEQSTAGTSNQSLFQQIFSWGQSKSLSDE